MSHIVTITEGRVKGKLLNDIRGKQYYSFQGIPYAKPPVFDLRFKAPQPLEPWHGIFDATTHGNPCIQRHIITKELIGSEDCLNLNVYTPQISNSKNTKLKPVMVFIHGGAFTQGSNKIDVYGPDFLLTEDIVLVVINYRLGMLGFLTLEDPSLEVPGNAGFKDMVLALKWVQRNIQNFMGDPNNVTLFGESAGAAAVHLLVLSPLSQGLFHRAILQSGCVLNGWIYSCRVGTELASEMGFTNPNEKNVLEFLQRASTEEIMRGQAKINANDILGNKSRYVGVAIEKKISDGAFFNSSPVDILLSGKFQKIPLIMGYNGLEGLLYEILVPDDQKSIYWDEVETHVPGLLSLEKGSELSKSIGRKIFQAYLNANESEEKRNQQIYELTTHNCFAYGICCAAKIHAEISKIPVYLYKMTIDSELNVYKRLSGLTTPGVCHADDLGYLFKNAFTPELVPGSIEDIGQRRFVRLWTNFAKYGNPTIDKDGLLDNVLWKPVEKNHLNYLEIGEFLELKRNPEDNGRMAFWDEIYKIKPLSAKNAKI